MNNNLNNENNINNITNSNFDNNQINNQTINTMDPGVETPIVSPNETTSSQPKKNKSSIIIIIVLIMIIIGSGIYICYDKGIIFNKESKTNSSTNNDNNTSKENVENKNEKSTETTNDDKLSIKEYYSGNLREFNTELNDYTESRESIFLISDGLYISSSAFSEGASHGTIGTYTISDNKILFTAKYSFGSACGISDVDSNSNFVATINNDKSLALSNSNIPLIPQTSDKYSDFYVLFGLCTEDETEAKKVYDMGLYIKYSKCDESGNNCVEKTYDGLKKEIR